MAFHSMVTMGSNNNKRTSKMAVQGEEAREITSQFSRTRRFRAGFHFVRVTLKPC
jgi:hypothetical protein